MSVFPLLRHDPAAILAYRDGRPVTAGQFLADVFALADTLPARRHVVNRIADRYRFSVGFAAALLREQITLLPPDGTAETMRRVVEQYRDVYAIADEPLRDAVLDHVPIGEACGLPAADHRVPAFDETRIAALIFTSGSTGQPIPHPRSWGSLVRSTAAAGRCFGLAHLPGAAVLATVLPQHSYGLESGVMLALQHGIALSPAHPFYPADIVRELELLPRPRILVTTPIHLRFLVGDAGALPPVDAIVSATAPLSPQLAAESETRFGAPLFEIYGCAEAGQIACRRTVAGEEWRTLDGIALSADEDGTWVEGETADRRTLLNDVIVLRGPDRFVLQGRKADLVNIAGKRTSLAHLNHQLTSVPGVKDGVFVLPEGTDAPTVRLVAFAVAPGLGIEDVKRALRERIDPVFMPRPLCLVERLPRNATGKLTRTEIDRMLSAEAQRPPGGRATIVFAPDIASAAGHFPGDPIVPGASLLQEVLRLLERETARFRDGCDIRAGKFLRPVRPGDSMDVRWTTSANGDIRFDCSVAEDAVVSGVIGDSAVPA